MTGTSAASNLQPLQSHRHRATACSKQMTVFCDFDGPLIDVSDRYYGTYRLALADTQTSYSAQGIAPLIQTLTKQQFWQMKQDRVPDMEIAMRSGLQSEQIDVFLHRVSEIVNQPTLLHKDKVHPGVNWALALLHSQGVRLVLVTLRCQDEATQILQNNGLAGLFSSIYGTQLASAAYQNYAEVKTQLLIKATEEQALSSSCLSSAWMVGDTEADILAGQALGIPTIGLTCGIRSHYRLKQFHPTCIHSNLLAAAHYLLGMTSLVRV